jgi:hypothetical protein
LLRGVHAGDQNTKRVLPDEMEQDFFVFLLMGALEEHFE